LPSGARAWLIGSLAWGGFGERSDIDVVLSGVAPAAATLIEENIARAAGVEVDILHLEDLPDSFRQRVEQEGIGVRGR
jgi:predicted nucleotidyltransferase